MVEEALGKIRPDVVELLLLPGGLDSLGNRGHAERVSQLHDGLDERSPGAILDLLDERTVDLQRVDRELLQSGERRVTCPEVVDGDVDPLATDGTDLSGDDGWILRESALGELQHQSIGLQPRPGENTSDPLWQTFVEQLVW